MTSEQRMHEISRRCKIPVEMVKQILVEETNIIIEELMRGEKCVMYGRVSMTPRICEYIDSNGETHKVMKVSCKVSQSLLGQLESLSELAEAKGQNIKLEENKDGYIVKSAL